MKNKKLGVCLISSCDSYSYVPKHVINMPNEIFGIDISQKLIRPITDDYINDYLTNKDNFGELNLEDDLIVFGRKITVNDIPKLEIGHLEIKIYQDVSEWFVKFIENYLNDTDFQDEFYDTESINMYDVYEIIESCGFDEIYFSYFIDDGGASFYNFPTKDIGYEINNQFGITTKYMMNDDDWSNYNYLHFYTKL